MNLQVIGCSHHSTPIEVRERLAFGPDLNRRALVEFRQRYPDVEAVLLSTCNRVELYSATENGDCPNARQTAEFLASFHELSPGAVEPHLYQQVNEGAVSHLFTVACSLHSMVLGEPQIVAQVKQAYQWATDENTAGPLLHAAFQGALKTARRVAGETTIQQRRISIPSVAVADFAQQIFETFDDKNTLILGAGEMAEETLRYLVEYGARRITVINRSPERAADLAGRFNGQTAPWEKLLENLAAADLVISTTGASEPIVTAAQFQSIEAIRGPRPLFVLDLAVPRDFDPAVGDRQEVYLYSVDDLQQACQRNRAERDKELPAARKIIEQETARFMTDLHHRMTGPLIRQLREDWQRIEAEELKRLWNKLPPLEESARREIQQAFDRLVNKLLHPPLETLRDESRHGSPRKLLDALVRLFNLRM